MGGKRKAANAAPTAAKKPKASVAPPTRSTRGSRAKAEQLIKKQVDVSESEEDVSSSDEFVLDSQSSGGNTSGAVVKNVNSFLSDSSSEDENSHDMTKNKKSTKKIIKKKKGDSESSESSDDDFEEPPPRLSRSKQKIDPEIESFESIENNILKGVKRLSDSDDSDAEMDEVTSSEHFVPTHVLFPQLVKKEVDIHAPSTSKQGFSSDHGEDKSRKSSIKNESSNIISGLDVSQLLALGESQADEKESNEKSSTSKSKRIQRSVKKEEKKPEKHSKSSSSKSSSKETSRKRAIKTEVKSESEEDWEEVEHQGERKQSVIPKEGVEITVQLPNFVRKKKKKAVDLASIIKRRINQIKRDNQVMIHKVSLLCWIGHGMYINKLLNSPSLMGVALSLIPSQHCYPPKQADLKYLENITKWFKKTVQLSEESDPSDKTLVEILESGFHSKKANNKRMLVLLFVCMMRSLGLKTRLIINFTPLPLKLKSDELCPVTNKPEQASTSKSAKTSEKTPAKSSGKSAASVKQTKSVTTSVDKNASKKSDTKSSKSPKINGEKEKQSSSKSRGSAGESKYFKSESKKESLKGLLRKNDKRSEKRSSSSSPEKSKNSSTTRQQKLKSEEANKTKSSVSSNSSGKTPIQKSPSVSPDKKKDSGARTLRQRKPSKYKDDSGESDQETTRKSKTSKQELKSKSETSKIDESDGSDFEPEIVAVHKRVRKVVDRRVLSSEEEEAKRASPKISKVKNGVDFWAEVFVEMEEKWISVDVPNGKVHCVTELYAKATSPVTYVVAFGCDQSVRDVSRRYCPQFYTVTRKQRVDADWWDGAVKPFYGRQTAHDKEEEADLDKQMQDRPLPKSIGEFKSHPLYALKRHLLKFEAIYPPDAPTLGFIREEAVYARECVFTLRSRETWVKEAKVVKPKEEPYKIVKSRPKYDRMSGQMVTDKPLEIFGPWQVEDYVPPPAVDGKVPRNEYGNVELFKPTMLPKGTVHLRISCLNRIAKKLQVDCAPAMVGFDYHCGGCHPVFDGFVVCEEFKDILIDAHRQDEEEREKRQEEKRQKRVYGNWKRLINGLLIREKLKRKYSFGSTPDQAAKPHTKKAPAKSQASSKNKKKSNTSSDSD